MSLDEHVLAHEGIKGMRWGIRRGPPYPLKRGIKTPIKSVQKSAAKKEPASKSATTSKPSKTSTSIRDLSDDELRRVISRLQMEKQYKELTAKQKSAGRKFVENLLTSSTQEIMKKYIVKYTTSYIDSVLEGKKKK